MSFLSRFLPTSRAACVALHGSAGSPCDWDAVRERLDPRTQFFAPALLGYGPGHGEWNPDMPLSLEHEARHVLSALPAHLPLDLVGHCYGGAVALQLAVLAPERVRSLTLYEPALFFLLHRCGFDRVATMQVEALERQVDLGVRLSQRERAAQAFLDFWRGPGSWLRTPAHERDAVTRVMAKVAAEFAAIRRTRIDLGTLRKLPCPIRIAYGSASPLVSHAIALHFKHEVPAARIETAAGAGHMAALTQPELAATLLFPGMLPKAARPRPLLAVA